MACIVMNLFTPINSFPLLARSTKPLAKIYASSSITTTTKKDDDTNLIRRSANYPPPIWKFDQIQSHRSPFVEEVYTRRANRLEEQVFIMLHEKKEAIDQLEFIDELQRLGISYHFETQIKQILTNIYNKNYLSYLKTHENNLYATSLLFRLLRQHSFDVSQDIFECYLSKDGEIKHDLYEDTKAILNLYEASYMLVEGEKNMELVMKSAEKILRKKLDDGKLDEEVGEVVSHALENPLHWRMSRLETRWFIDIYEKRSNKNPILLEFAKLDFNIVQAQHLQDLKHMSRWWQNTRLAEELTFARDRVVESFFWTIGLMFEPRYAYQRKILTKIVALITIIDDVYDVYGTLDELELFTDVVERWDINAIKKLPEYMKVCFLELDNHVNNMAYDHQAVKNHADVDNITPYLRKGWVDLCKVFLQEAKWYFSGYTPTLEEYLNNAWISVGGPAIFMHAYFLTTSPIEDEGLRCLNDYHDLIRWSSIIVRLANDLVTTSDEMKPSDVPKFVQCYMNEVGISEERARERVRIMIGEIWKKLNKARVIANSPFSETFIITTVNFARMAQCIYEHGDGHGHSNVKIKNRINKLIFDSIPLAL